MRERESEMGAWWFFRFRERGRQKGAWVFFLDSREGEIQGERKKRIVIHNCSLRERGQKSGVQVKE